MPEHVERKMNIRFGSHVLNNVKLNKINYPLPYDDPIES